MRIGVAKDLIHIDEWLARAATIVAHGRDAYVADVLLHEAGDSLMMKLGEAARRLAAADIEAPAGVDWSLAIANRNFLIHQYDQIDRVLTWSTLAVNLPAWRKSLTELIDEARSRLPQP